MARKRMLDPHIWESAYDKGWKAEDFLVMTAAISASDDEAKGRVSMIIRNVGRMITTRKLKKSLENLKDSIIIYREIYFFLPNFFDYQKISHPSKSKIPNPTIEEINTYLKNTPESFREPLQKSGQQVKLIEINLNKVKGNESKVNVDNTNKTFNETSFKNDNGKENQLTYYLPNDFEQEQSVKQKIELMLNDFTNMISDTQTIINFYNMITDPNDGVSSPTAFKICYEVCKKYNSFKPEKKNYGYLFTKTKGEINDALIKAREKRAQRDKDIEKEEIKNMPKIDCITTNYS